MLDYQYDNLNGHVVLKKAIELIDNTYKNNDSNESSDSYMSDRIVYLNSYLRHPHQQVPYYVFGSAYNMMLFLNSQLTTGKETTVESYIRHEVEFELKRLSEDGKPDE